MVQAPQQCQFMKRIHNVFIMLNAKVRKNQKIHEMDNTIVIPQSVRVLVKMGNKPKEMGVEALVGMLKEYKDK